MNLQKETIKTWLPFQECRECGSKHFQILPGLWDGVGEEHPIVLCSDCGKEHEPKGLADTFSL